MKTMYGHGVVKPNVSGAYGSHGFVTVRTPTEYGTGFEYVRYCAHCGCEDQGDPAEFPHLEYTACGTGGD